MSCFDVTILGCSSATPTIDRHPTAQLINICDTLLLVDCGEGTQNQLLRYQLKFQKLHAVLISHLHGDHVLGLPGLLSTMSLNGRKEPLHIFSAEPLKHFLEHFCEISMSHFNFELIFHFTDAKNFQKIYEYEHFSISTFPLSHRIDCTGFIIDETENLRKLNIEKCKENYIPVEYYNELKKGKDYIAENIVIKNSELTFNSPLPRKYIYSSDTVYDERILEHIMNADLLYHETTFMHELEQRATETFHTTALQAAHIAKKANAKKLLIGHFSARYKEIFPLVNEAKTVFENTEAAEEGKTFHV